MKNAGIILIIIGIVMIMITGFNYVTEKKVVDVGSIQINKKENHPVQWSPVVGIVLLAGGLVIMFTQKSNAVK